MISERIAEWAMKIWKGNKTVVEEIRRINKSIEASDEGIVGVAPEGMRVGILFGLEPPLAVVQLGFLLFGQRWPLTNNCKTAMKKANEMWRQEVKVKKTNV